MDLESDYNETNQLHLNTETLKSDLKLRHGEWKKRQLTNSFRADMQADIGANNTYIYILAAVGGTFALLILICVVGRHYVKIYALNWAQRKNKQVENGNKSMELCYQRSSALEKA